MARAKSAPKDSTAHLGFEAKLWSAGDIYPPQGSAGFVLAKGNISPTNPAKPIFGAPSSRPTSWTAWSPSPAGSLKGNVNACSGIN